MRLLRGIGRVFLVGGLNGIEGFGKCCCLGVM
jgi:hypothetical protein